MLVDIHANNRRAPSEWQKQSFFGQLQHILQVQLPACPHLNRSDSSLRSPSVILLAGIRTCTLEERDDLGLKFRFYRSMGGFEVVDMNSVQCLIGRIKDRGEFAIIDRTSTQNEAEYNDGD